jgi:ribonuclease Z
MSALRRLIEIHSFQQPYLKESFDAFMAKMKIKKFKPTKVFHCPFSYGIVIEHNNGLKISYSGDCRPTEEFL